MGNKLLDQTGKDVEGMDVDLKDAMNSDLNENEDQGLLYSVLCTGTGLQLWWTFSARCLPMMIYSFFD